MLDYWGGGGGLAERLGSGQDLPATCWTFVIPKSSEKVSMIFHLMDFNEVLPPPPPPPRFSSCSWEQVADRLCS